MSESLLSNCIRILKTWKFLLCFNLYFSINFILHSNILQFRESRCAIQTNGVPWFWSHQYRRRSAPGIVYQNTLEKCQSRLEWCWTTPVKADMRFQCWLLTKYGIVDVTRLWHLFKCLLHGVMKCKICFICTYQCKNTDVWLPCSVISSSLWLF